MGNGLRKMPSMLILPLYNPFLPYNLFTKLIGIAYRSKTVEIQYKRRETENHPLLIFQGFSNGGMGIGRDSVHSQY